MLHTLTSMMEGSKNDHVITVSEKSAEKLDSTAGGSQSSPYSSSILFPLPRAIEDCHQEDCHQEDCHQEDCHQEVPRLGKLITSSKARWASSSMDPSVINNSTSFQEVIGMFQEMETKMTSSHISPNRRQLDRRQLDKLPVDNQRIGKVFSLESSGHSQLIKPGQPNIYMLNAREIRIDDKLRWFEIGQVNTKGLQHKYIILMGATGSGKSTLINGMVNYILGVQWKDPFRFKCVREDESAAQNQAHSQTSSVTAYTIHHHEGMAVPYSITIIDTPGYGDTRGIARDKKITKTIHRFLTGKETRLDEIHAVCLVAASSDSRLTPTQRYILDSVLSIFGKDVRDNIRLLVTFADNVDPPVVEACRAGNFPLTSPSAGIVYSKFNSSVLYATNLQHGEDDFSFDELFWDMGQENFTKFFTMLEGMNGRDLTSTRQVIQCRGVLEQSLKAIEDELEVCLDNIEKIEKFRQEMRGCNYKMESNKNFTIENTESRLKKVDCYKGFFAYNCRKCKSTCKKPIRGKSEKKYCLSGNCLCPPSDHFYQPFEWRQIEVKMTLNSMKKEYEANCNDKLAVEQLMKKCEDELNVTKAKVLSLLDQVGASARYLDSTALRSSALSPADYISFMRSKVAEEQKTGYSTRLQTLDSLQRSLSASNTIKQQDNKPG